MGWSADWHIPRARIDDKTFRHVLERECARVGYKLGYLVAKDDAYTHAGIEISVDGKTFSGCLELWSNEETEAGETSWSMSAIDDILECDDEDLDEDGYPVEKLLPYQVNGFGAASLGSVEIVGTGEAKLELDRYRNLARVRRVLPRDLANSLPMSDSDMFGVSGLLYAHGRTWLFGGPKLLFVDGTRIPVTFEPDPEITDQQIAALHPIDRGRAIAVLDAGTVWKIDVDSGETRKILPIPETDDYNGYWDAQWSIAALGDELWIANGSDRVYRLLGDGVARVQVEGVERVVAASDGRIWLQCRNELLVNERGSTDAFRTVHARDDGRKLDSLTAGPAGRVVAFVAGPPAWRAKEDGLSPEQAASRLVVLDGDVPREVVLELPDVFSFKSAVCTPGELVWASTRDHVLAIEPGGPPHTRLTVRSNRDDNREDAVWDRICTFADIVAGAFGGWDATRA
jgi:hypothetical protein